MEFHYSFRIVNSDYSQQLAEEYDFGQDSDGNRRYIGINSFLCKIKEAKPPIKTDFELRLDNDNQVFLIKDVVLVEFVDSNDLMHSILVSKALLLRNPIFNQSKTGITRCYFDLRADAEANVYGNNYYIARNDIPTGLHEALANT